MTGANAGPEVRRWLSRGHGVYLIGAAVLVGGSTWLVLALIAPLAVRPPYEPSLVPAPAAWWVAHRAWAPLLALPALVTGVVLLRRSSWLLIVLGTLALLIPFATVLYCVVSLLAPLYRGQPL